MAASTCSGRRGSGDSRSRGSGCRTGSTFWTRIKPARLCRELPATLIRRLCRGAHRRCAAKPSQSNQSIRSHPPPRPATPATTWAMGRRGLSGLARAVGSPSRFELAVPPGPPPPSPAHLPHLPGRQGTKKPPPQTDSLPALSRPFSRSALVPSWMICDPTRNATITCLSLDNRITSKTQHTITILHPPTAAISRIASLLDD